MVERAWTEFGYRRFGFYFCLGLSLAMISWANPFKHSRPQFPHLQNRDNDMCCLFYLKFEQENGEKHYAERLCH